MVGEWWNNWAVHNHKAERRRACGRAGWLAGDDDDGREKRGWGSDTRLCPWSINCRRSYLARSEELAS